MNLLCRCRVLYLQKKNTKFGSHTMSKFGKPITIVVFTVGFLKNEQIYWLIRELRNYYIWETMNISWVKSGIGYFVFIQKRKHKNCDKVHSLTHLKNEDFNSPHISSCRNLLLFEGTKDFCLYSYETHK